MGSYNKNYYQPRKAVLITYPWLPLEHVFTLGVFFSVLLFCGISGLVDDTNKSFFSYDEKMLKPGMTTQCLTRMNFFLHSVVLHYITNLKKKEDVNRKPTETKRKMIAEQDSMKPALARLSHVLLTRGHHLRLLSNFLQPAQHNAVARRKPVDHVLDLGLFAEILHERLQSAEVVTGNARE